MPATPTPVNALIARHDFGTLLPSMSHVTLVILRLKPNRLNPTSDFLTSGFGMIFTTIGGL